MVFSNFIRTESNVQILFKNPTPIENVGSIKFYKDDAIGTYQKKEFRWSFDRNYWSSWEILNQGNLTALDPNGLNLYFEIRYIKNSSTSNVTFFSITYIESITSINIISTCNDVNCNINTSSLINADLLNSKNANYFLNRTNHKGQQPITSITNLQNIINGLINANNQLINNATNIDGSGVGTYYQKNSQSLIFKNLIGGHNVLIDDDSAGHLTINFSDVSIIDVDSSLANLTNWNNIQDISIVNQDLSINDLLIKTNNLNSLTGFIIGDTSIYAADPSYIYWDNINKTLHVSSQSMPINNGCIISPTFIDNSNGSFTVGNGIYTLNSSNNGLGFVKSYAINGSTFTLQNEVTSYLVADYNNGNPIIKILTDITPINETTIIPIFTLFRQTNTIYPINWDLLGISLPNKLNRSIVKTQRFRRQTGLLLSETFERKVNISSGISWIGAVEHVIPYFDSSVNNMYLWYHVNGVWTSTLVKQYNNTQYDDGTNLQTLSNNTRYAVNFIYKAIGDSMSLNHSFIVLGTDNYTLNQAINSQPPALPPLLSQMCILIGRIIIARNSTSSYAIDSAFNIQFTNSSVPDHASLVNLKWVVSGHYDSANTIAGFDASGIAKSFATAGTGSVVLSSSQIAQDTSLLQLDGSITKLFNWNTNQDVSISNLDTRINKNTPLINQTFNGQFNLSTNYEVYYNIYNLDSSITPTISANPLITAAARLIINASTNASVNFVNMGTKMPFSDDFTINKSNEIIIVNYPEGLNYVITILN